MLKIIKTLVLTIFTYLLQVTVFPLLPINDIAGNIIIAGLAVIIVAVGRQHGFASSLISGILMEVMVSSLPYLHLLAYPLLGVLGLLFFADKTDRRLEMERVTKKKYKGNINPLIRTFLCTIFLTIIFEMVNIFYELLRGVSFDLDQLIRALGAILYNVLITAIIVIPIRKFYGLRSYFPRFGRKKAFEIADVDPSRGIQPIVPIEFTETENTFKKSEFNSTLDKNPDSITDIDFENQVITAISSGNEANTTSIGEEDKDKL